MNVLVHSKTVPVTGAIREFVDKQIRKITKLSQPVTEVRVFLDSVRTSQGLNQEAKVKVKISTKGRDILVGSKAHDLYLAISQAIAEGARAVRRQKEKRLTKKLHPRFKVAMK